MLQVEKSERKSSFQCDNILLPVSILENGWQQIQPEASGQPVFYKQVYEAAAVGLNQGPFLNLFSSILPEPNMSMRLYQDSKKAYIHFGPLFRRNENGEVIIPTEKRLVDLQLATRQYSLKPSEHSTYELTIEKAQLIFETSSSDLAQKVVSTRRLFVMDSDSVITVKWRIKSQTGSYKLTYAKPYVD